MASLLLAVAVVFAQAQTGVAQEAKRDVMPLRDYRRAALAARGDAGRGNRLFEAPGRTQCSGCHAVGGRGVTIGPDLSGQSGPPAVQIPAQGLARRSARLGRAIEASPEDSGFQWDSQRRPPGVRARRFSLYRDGRYRPAGRPERAWAGSHHPARENEPDRRRSPRRRSSLCHSSEQSGFRPFSDRYSKSDARYVAPVFAYHHRVGVSVTGGFVYRGRKNPALAAKYIFGDYETRRVWALEQRERTLKSIVEIGRSPERIVWFGVDSDDELYIVGLDRGQIYQIDATSSNLEAAVPSLAVELVPTSRQQGIPWKRTETRPPGEWPREDFDDSTWTDAPGGFGTRGTPGAIVRTEWRSPDIWLRRTFTLPEVDRKALSLLVHHDEDAEIYLNGALAAPLTGFGADYDDVAILDEARAALRPGANTLAVHCHQTRGGQYIDVGITENRSRPPTSSVAP